MNGNLELIGLIQRLLYPLGHVIGYLAFVETNSYTLSASPSFNQQKTAAFQCHIVKNSIMKKNDKRLLAREKRIRQLQQCKLPFRENEMLAAKNKLIRIMVVTNHTKLSNNKPVSSALNASFPVREVCGSTPEPSSEIHFALTANTQSFTDA